MYIILRDKYKFHIEKIEEIKNELHLTGNCKEYHGDRIVTIVIKKSDSKRIINN